MGRKSGKVVRGKHECYELERIKIKKIRVNSFNSCNSRSISKIGVIMLDSQLILFSKLKLIDSF